MINELYYKYFQKSKAFLYPLLGIKKSSNFSPLNFYIAFEGKIEPDDMKLICSFKPDDSEGFSIFENKVLLTNPLYVETIKLPDQWLYVFNYEIHKNDWFNFLLGKYSKFTPTLKNAVKSYYGESSKEYKYIQTFLYPEKYRDTYAKLLNVSVKLLNEVEELCDPCDLEKETLKISMEKLEDN